MPILTCLLFSFKSVWEACWQVQYAMLQRVLLVLKVSLQIIYWDLSLLLDFTHWKNTVNNLPHKIFQSFFLFSMHLQRSWSLLLELIFLSRLSTVLDIWRLNWEVPLIFSSSFFSLIMVGRNPIKGNHANLIKCTFDANLKHILFDNVLSEKHFTMKSA